MNSKIFEILEEVIAEDYKVKLDTANSLVIEETNRNAKGKQVNIKTSGKVFTFSLEQNKPVFKFFNNATGGINKVNDAVLICCRNNEIYALIVELKSDNPREYIKQLLSGKNFVEFVKSTISLHYDISFDIKYRGFLFDTRCSSAKKSTTKRNKIELTNIGCMDIGHLRCNDTYFLAQLLE